MTSNSCLCDFYTQIPGLLRITLKDTFVFIQIWNYQTEVHCSKYLIKCKVAFAEMHVFYNGFSAELCNSDSHTWCGVISLNISNVTSSVKWNEPEMKL